MNYKDREKMFAKDYLTIKDMQELLGVDYQTASKIIRQIRFKYDRLKILGKLHVEDYFEYFGIKDRQRYLFKEKKHDHETQTEDDYDDENQVDDEDYDDFV